VFSCTKIFILCEHNNITSFVYAKMEVCISSYLLAHVLQELNIQVVFVSVKVFYNNVC